MRKQTLTREERSLLLQATHFSHKTCEHITPAVEQIIASRVEMAWLAGFRFHRDEEDLCDHGYGPGDHHWEDGTCLAHAAARPECVCGAPLGSPDCDLNAHLRGPRVAVTPPARRDEGATD